MVRMTKVMLEHANAMLRSDIRQIRADLTFAQERASLHKNQYHLLENHISVMTIGNERLADALSHAIGFTTDPNRQKHIQRIADEVYKEKYGEEVKR